MPPPSARTRSRLRSETVSQWSKNQFSPLNETSRFTSSNTFRKRVMLSSTTFEVNFLCVRPAQILLGVVHANDAAIFNREVRCFGTFRIERGDAAVVKNQVGLSG